MKRLNPVPSKRGGINLKTKVIGKRIYEFKSISSTNDFAKDIAEKEKEGTVVIAKAQTKGRGRFGRYWTSPPGGLYLSIILKPKIKPKDTLKLTLLTGVAVSETVEKLTGLKTQLKWPNDVLINRRKVCGILTEATTKGNKVLHSVVGIGINVNNALKRYKNFSNSYALKYLYEPTSIREETGRKFSLKIITERLLENFERIYFPSKKKRWKEILKNWKEKSDTIGSKVRVTTKDGDVEGIAVDIDEDGFLLVKKKTGRIERIIEGDLFYL